MTGSGLDEEDVPPDDAVKAFDALRAEVAQLRQALETLPAALKESQPKPAPDYSADLGKIVKGLTEVDGRLGAIEQHPALRLTPEQHRQAIAHAGDDLMRRAVNQIDRASREVQGEREQLAGLIGATRSRDEQFYWLLWTGLAALVVGFLLSPFVAGVLPLGLDSRVAALVMKADRWSAGAALMAAENPEGWREVVDATELMRANREAIKACREAAVKAKKEQRCVVNVAGR